MDKEKVWKDTVDIIQISVSKATFSTWFAQTFIISVQKLENGRQIVEIGCPSSFIADTIEHRYFGLIQNTLNQITELQNDLIFSVKQKSNGVNNTNHDTPLFAEEKINPEVEEILERTLRNSRIRTGFTFDNFAVSGTNQMAWAAAEAVAKNLASAYNPLFLWGGVGVGKTHLMLAIACKTLKQKPDTSVLYCMGEEFTNEIVEAIRNKTTQSFKNKYRKLKLLMIDDIQFLAGKNAVQEEFFHTFNTLQREGGQIVLTSDRPPSEIDKLEERLRSRFEAGLIIDIAPPEFELRTAIALIKAKEKGVDLPMPLAQAIAANIDSARKIEGFITRIYTQVQLGKEEINEQTINKLLGQTKPLNNFKRHTTPPEFIEAVSQHFSLGKRRLMGEGRARSIAVPRQILMYLLRIELGLPLQEVGRIVGGRDHTTVMHAVEKISKNLSTNEDLRADILGIKRSVSG